MTTVAYRDGLIAADTGISIGGIRIGRYTKIARNLGGDLCGCAGHAGFATAFLKWFCKGELNGGEPTPLADDQSIDRAIIIRVDDRLCVHVREPNGWHQIKLTAQQNYFAIGTGREIALGAMWKDGTAKEAIQAAVDFDLMTFDEIETLEAINHGTGDRDRNGRS